MKIGLSYSRCVRDLVEGIVDMDDVLVIVARTDFDPRDDHQWRGIWLGYNGGSFISIEMEWGNYTNEDEQRFRDVSIELWETGRLHQPRKFGWRPRRMPYYWLETVLPDSELESRPAVKDAWNQFQMLAGLTNTKIDRHSV